MWGDEAQHVGVAQHEMQQNQTYDANAYTPKRLPSALFNSRELFAVRCLLFPPSHTLMTIYSCRPRTSSDSSAWPTDSSSVTTSSAAHADSVTHAITNTTKAQRDSVMHSQRESVTAATGACIHTKTLSCNHKAPNWIIGPAICRPDL
jgi:hypothetical protein